MFKRIVFSILAVVMAALTLCGCSFFRHDYERDMQQEIATVKSYSIENTLVDDKGEVVLDDNGEAKVVEFTTEKKTVYKLDLVEYVNNNANNLSSSFGGDAKALYNYAATMLVNLELVTNEVDALIASNRIEWGLTEQNNVKKNIYGVIDNTIFQLKNTILTERGQEPVVGDDNNSDSSSSGSSTTYPVKPDPEEDDIEIDGEEKGDTEVWQPDRITWPGINGDNETRSLEREALRRFISLIESRVKDDFRLGKAQHGWLKKKIDNEMKAIDKLIDTQGIEYVYGVIGNYTYPMKESESEFGYLMYYLSGESLERSQKITSMQNYLSENVTVNYEEVSDKYASLVGEQRSNYTADIAAYDTAVNDSSTTVLYHANNNYFYVKHILLPFSDEQKSSLTAFKNSPEIKNLQEDEKNAKINEYRERLAESIVCYPHKDGEDDKTKPMSVDEVLAHIRSVMLPKQANIVSANDAFNDLIYLYNTDPGAFGNDKGYIVKYKLDEGEDETYMQEFADAARYMRDNIEVGHLYDEKVITDYGVHIMYLSSVNKPGAVGLFDKTSVSSNETYYDLLEKPIRTNRENAAYTNWENNILTYNYKKYSTVYTDAFSNLWED